MILRAVRLGVPMILSFGDTLLFAEMTEYHGRYGLEEMHCTSQWFRMADRPPATDLRGGNTSEDSFTRSMANLVVAYVVDFQSDSLSGVGLGSAARVEDSGRAVWFLPGIDTI